MMIYRSEQQLKNITSFLAEGIYVLNESGWITFMNPEAERLLGWTVEELANKNAHDIIHCHGLDGTHLSLEQCPMRNVIKSNILQLMTFLHEKMEALSRYRFCRVQSLKMKGSSHQLRLLEISLNSRALRRHYIRHTRNWKQKSERGLLI